MKTSDFSSVELRDKLASLIDSANDFSQRVVDAQHRHALATRSAVISGDHPATAKTAAALDAARRAHNRANELVEAAELALSEAKEREREEAEAAARQHVADTLAEMAVSAREADQMFAAAAGILERLRAKEIELHRFVRSAFGIGRSPTSSPLIVGEAGTGFGVFLRSVVANNRTDARPWTADAVAAAAGNIHRGLAQ